MTTTDRDDAPNCDSLDTASDQQQAPATPAANVTLLVCHPSLQQDAERRLATHEGLLTCAEWLTTSLVGLRAKPVRLGGVVAAIGSYQQDLYMSESRQRDLPAIATGEHLLVQALENDCRELRENGVRPQPLPRKSLGIPDARFGLLIALVDADSYGARVGLRNRATQEVVWLPVPDRADLDALPRIPPEPRPVAGKLTGVGVYENYCRVEINLGKPLIVEDLSLREAVEKMLGGYSVEGNKVNEGGVFYLRDFVFVDKSVATDLFPSDS